MNPDLRRIVDRRAGRRRRRSVIVGRNTRRRSRQPQVRLPRNWRTVRALVLARDGHACQIRLDGCTGTATNVDHIVPRADGGSHDPSNLRAACEHCNKSRGARWAASRRWSHT